MKLKLTLVAIVLILLHFAAPVSYAQSFALSLYPERHEVISKPGQTITLPYSLSNLGDPTLLAFKIYTLKSSTDGYELVPFKGKTSEPTFAVINSAIEMGKPFLMNAKSTVLFDVQVTIPQEVNLQDYYFTFVAESEGMKGSEGVSSLNLEPGVGSHILLTVTDSGTLERVAQLKTFEIASASFFTLKGERYYFVDSFKQVPLTLVVVNKGSNYVKATGAITGLRDVIAITETTILSGSERTLKMVTIPSDFIGMKTLSAAVTIENAQVLYGNVHIVTLPFTIITWTLALMTISLYVFFFIKYKQKK